MTQASGAPAAPVFDFFVSYSQEDREWVEQLVRRLRQRGLRGYVDADLSPGDHWPSVLESALLSAKACLLIVTEASSKSTSVAGERATALVMASAGRMKIIPIVVGQTSIATMPPALQEYEAIRIQQLVGGPEADMVIERLADAISAPPNRDQLAVIITTSDSDFVSASDLLSTSSSTRFQDWNILVGQLRNSAWRGMIFVSKQTGIEHSASFVRLINALSPDVVIIQTSGFGIRDRAEAGDVVLASSIHLFLDGSLDRGIIVPTDPRLVAVAREVSSDRLQRKDDQPGNVAVAGVLATNLIIDTNRLNRTLEGFADDVATVIFEPLAGTVNHITAPLIIVTGIVDSADRARNISGAANAATTAVTQDMLAILSQLSAPDQLAALTGVGIVGFGDRPSEVDLLGRSSIIQTLVYLLTPALTDIAASASSEESGPTLVSLEGPWGTGKTTFLHHLRKAVDELSQTTKQAQGFVERAWNALGWGLNGKLTVGQANRKLRKASQGDASPNVVQSQGLAPITVWFNPWAHQSSEQVWAGLSAEIAKAVVPELCPSSNLRERYWFDRNIERIDRRRLERDLHRRILSPLFKISLFALIVPILAQLARTPDKVDIPDWIPLLPNNIRPMLFIVAVPVLIIVGGLIHTAWRYFFSRASSFLPDELFVGSILSGNMWDDSQAKDTAIMDPLRRARSGRLYLLQHGVYDILADAKRANRYLVTFIDDLDRCGPRTTAEVFEAINLFLSGEFSGARFVLAVDPSVVAAQLSTIFADSNKANVAVTPDDPDIGWAFLRKFVQLPVILPVTRSKQRRDPLEGLLGSMESVEASYSSTADDIAEGADLSVPSKDKQEERSHTDIAESTQDRSADEIHRNVRMARIEHNEVFQHRLKERLDARPGCSMREIKRLLTVWQFYVRQMDRDAPARSAEMVERACHLLILAEIVTRWPAIQDRIHRPVEGQRGLEVLAKASSDDLEWERSVGKLGLTGERDMEVCNALRQLLKDYDGLAVANLAVVLF